MARTKVTGMIELKSWEEVDDALRAIGEHRRDIRAVENVLNEQIAAARAAATDRTRPLQEQITQNELAIQTFVTRNRADMGSAKTKALHFGEVSFRKSTRLVVPKAAEKVAAIIARLRALGMSECVKQATPTVDKEALKKYSADKIAECGASVVTSDEFGYKLYEDRIR